MTIRKYIEAAPILELEKYNRSQNYRKECTAFDGTPRKHPYDPEKILLIQEPFSGSTQFLEFSVLDIQHAEELAGLSTEDGENIPMIRFWIKTGSHGIKLTPFIISPNEKT